MKNLLTLLVIFFMVGCAQMNNYSSGVDENKDAPVITKENELDEENEQDGIREAQEMEFEMTKDVSLGYVPKNRLIQAYNDLMEQRKLQGNGPLSVSALTWTERGPNTDVIGPSNGNTRGTQAATDAVTSGRMRAIWVDIADGTVWAGSISGGLWHTTDITSTSAAVWSVVNDFFGNLAVSSICQDPSNTNIMYFGTGEKTFNVDAVAGGGIWRSTDHGVTWSLMAGTTGYTNVSKVVCDASGNLYVATIGANGVLRFTKSTSTWTNITPSGLVTYATELRISSTGRLHVACGYSNAGTSGFRFTDNPSTVTSATWTSPTTAVPAALTAYNVELAVAANTLYAQCANSSYAVGGIYKSTDGGANWAAVTTPPNGTTEPSILPGGQGWYDLAIGCDPTTPNTVIAGGLNFYRSTDGGTTWSQITRWVGTANNYVHADHHTVVWNTNGTGAGTQVLVGCDGGLFYSNNNGVSFADRNDGLRIKQFYSCAIHPTSGTNYFIAGAQDNGTHQLTSAGLGGSIEVKGGDGSYTHIDQDEPQYQFSGYVRSDYMRSTDGGATWNNVTHSTSTSYQFINPTDYDDVTNRMYLAGIGGQYVRWENPQSGSTFTAVAVAAFGGSQAGSVTVSPYTLNRVFFGTLGGKVVRVDNAQAASPTATDITGTGMNATRVSCVALGTTDNNLLATFSNYGSQHVWVSTTGGGSGGWTNISGNLPDIPVRWAMFYPEDNTKAIIATELGVYETNLINGASTVWTQNTSFPIVKTNMLQYRKGDGTVLAATHGRGLWTATIPFTNPYVRFGFNNNIQTEATSTSGATCRNYKDYTVPMTIDQAPVGNANITISVAGGGTATQGVDYDFTTNGNFVSPSNTLSFASGSTAPQTVTIRIYNDAEIESSESFTLNYSIGGGTNALAAPSSSSYTFNITDNDVAPVVSTYGGNFSVGTANTTLSTQTPFRSNLQKFRIQYLFTAAELASAGITSAGNITSMTINVTTKNSTKPYTGFTIGMANTSSANLSTGFVSNTLTQVYSGNYSSVAGINTFNFSTAFAWDGSSNVVVNFCFDNEPGTPDVLSDVVQGTTAPLGTGVRASTYSNSVTGPGCSLAAAFIADSRITTTFGATNGNPVETVLNQNRSEYVSNNGTYYFFNGYNILGSINGSSASLGCVSNNIYEAGTTWQTFGSGLRSQKVFEITPTTNSGASYTVGLYFTAAELGGQTPATLKIAKTNAATMALATNSNTISAPTAVTAFGTGYLFTASFTGFSKFFLIDASVVLPVTLISFNGLLNNQGKAVLNWNVTNETNLRKYEIERSYDGVQFVTAGSVDATAGSAVAKNYGFTDAVTAKSVNYYRLKMIDNNGRFRYSDIVILKNDISADMVSLLKNPVQNSILLSINNSQKDKIVTELYNASGQLINKWNIGAADGSVQLPFNNNVAAGTYTLRVTIGKKAVSLKVVKL